MTTTASARRYAQAIFEIALEKGEEDRWLEDLSRMGEVMAHDDLAPLLQNPTVSVRKKQELLKECLEGLSPLAMNLAYLLVAKGRGDIASDVAAGYESLLDLRRGVEHAEVITAVPLTEKELERVRVRLGEITGGKVVLESRIASEMVGGLIIRIGDRLMDGSVRAKLEGLKRDLIHGGGEGR